jgi:hypothetical protein
MPLAVIAMVPCYAVAADTEGSHDYPGLGRVSDYHISNYQERRFGPMTFTLDGDRKVNIQGHTFVIDYAADQDRNHASVLEILRDYETVLKGVGATILRAPVDYSAGTLVARFASGTIPVYVAVVPTGNYGNPDGREYRLYIAEERDFVPTIK